MAKSKRVPLKTIPPAGLLDDRPLEDQLRLKNGALAACAEGISIADATQPDYPLIYVNRGFEKLTGYSASEVCGTNCRFLQGKDTDLAAIEEIRNAINEKRECVVEILNYRKNGEPFWNRLSIAPIRNEAGDVTHFMGIQSDVTSRRSAEDALRLANADLERANRIITKDLEAAATIQSSFLPSRSPTLQGVTAAWELLPCDELAGDMLNVLTLNDRYIAFYVLDVSGHGVQAALLSVTLHHWLSPQTGRVKEVLEPSGASHRQDMLLPIDVLNGLNRQFPFDPLVGQYFTIVYGILDTRTNQFRFVAAGHPPSVYIPKGGAAMFLGSNNFPIGIVAEPDFQENTIDLKSGDRIYLYSDGLVDMENSRGDRFGDRRLLEAIDSLKATSMNDSPAALITRLKEWSGKDRFRDDISILGFEIA